MQEGAEKRYEEVASAFEWIIDRAWPSHPERRSCAIKVLIGGDVVEEKECAPYGSIVSVSEAGVHLWYRPYSQPGAPRFTSQRLHGLFEFMRFVVWPAMVGEWRTDRLMLEPQVDDVERAAIDHYRKLEEDGREITLNDIKNLLQDSPHLHGFYSAVRSLDVDEIRKYAAEIPSELNEIGREQIEALLKCIASASASEIKAQKEFLIFRTLVIAARPLFESGRFDWQSAQYSDNVDKTLKQFKYLSELARRRYTKEFMTFCMSKEMLDLKANVFSELPERNGQVYQALVASFVAEQLASTEHRA
jgi:hypothetical protein